MTNAGQLFFGNVPWFPVVWVIGLLGFIACWWYVCRDVPAVRRLFLVLWLPAALVASAVYKLEGHNQAVTETLRLIAERDPATLRLLLQTPADGFAATYALAVGGAVAALSTMGLQLAGMVLGAIVSVSPAARRGGPGR
jgi:hypothetical protein